MIVHPAEGLTYLDLCSLKKFLAVILDSLKSWPRRWKHLRYVFVAFLSGTLEIASTRAMIASILASVEAFAL
tara:strand:+ start:332 stop:547 length:216 start_codon:yes stop_codon:yes gene_type:complete